LTNDQPQERGFCRGEPGSQGHFGFNNNNNSKTTLQSQLWSCLSSFPPVIPEVNNEKANASFLSFSYCILDQQIRESATTHLETAANEDFVRTQALRLFSIVLSSLLHTYRTMPLLHLAHLTCSGHRQSRDTYSAKGQVDEKILGHSKEQGLQQQQGSKDTGNGGKRTREGTTQYQQHNNKQNKATKECALVCTDHAVDTRGQYRLISCQQDA